MRPQAIFGLCGALLVSSCSDTATLPPFGEVVIVVDTDMPVPRIVDHVRIDVYSADGTSWLSSRDVSLPTASALPLSFSVHEKDTNASRDALVRLRAYGSQYIADYLGETFVQRPVPINGIGRFDPAPLPALVYESTSDCPTPLCLYDSHHVNVTPRRVPLAALAIDRLARVHLSPGAVRAAHITLAANCVGTGADLSGLRTCVDTEATLIPVANQPLFDDLTIPATSKQGSFEKQFQTPCTARSDSGLHDSGICVPGGVFVFGARNLIIGDDRDAFPERMTAVPSLLIDKYEFSVARFRDALQREYKGPTGVPPNNGPANDPTLTAPTAACTWSDAPMGREDAPLNCVTAKTASALCQFYGGDLPTEAQWEYVATVAGRDSKTLTPSLDGRGYAACDGVVIARAPKAVCASFGYGTAPVNYGETNPRGDVTFGVVGLSANVAELVKDTFASLKSVCWQSASLVSPTCASESDSDLRDLRGAAWTSQAADSSYMQREGRGPIQISNDTGFRCVRSKP